MSTRASKKNNARHPPDDDPVIDWLLDSDVSIQYQVYRDLLGDERTALQKRIARQGWGGQLMANRHADGSWGEDFYRPKWACTHYTLLELKRLAIAPNNRPLRASIAKITSQYVAADGGIGHVRGTRKSDVCINGMFLNYACYFAAPQARLESVIDFVLTEHMADGGFNCRSNRSGAKHSSLHSTLSVLEGLLEYKQNGYRYRIADVSHAVSQAREFILQHHLFRSDRTGKVIDKNFLKLPYPPRWRYNILKSLDYFQAARFPFDDRMSDALAHLQAQQTAQGRWLRPAAIPGKSFFTMEPARAPSRWNTLLALRVLKRYVSPWQRAMRAAARHRDHATA